MPIRALGAIGELVTEAREITDTITDTDTAQRLADLLDRIDGCAAMALLAA